VSGCTLSTSSAVVHCTTGNLSQVQPGYDISDAANPGALPSGTTVLSVGSGSLTLSAHPTQALSAQVLTIMPSSPPTCAGGSNSVVLGANGATCTVLAGFPVLGTPYSVTVTYSGDANNAGSVSHALKFRVH
jgi:hypothetical protein